MTSRDIEAAVQAEQRRARPCGRMIAGTRGEDIASRPETFVLFETGTVEQRVVHDQLRVEQRRAERELEGLAERYSAYAAASPDPVSFLQYVELVRDLHE